MTPHYYEINVAKMQDQSKLVLGVKAGYAHFFATSPRSITSTKELAEVYNDFKEKFPKPEFDISISAKYEYEETMPLPDDPCGLCEESTLCFNCTFTPPSKRGD